MEKVKSKCPYCNPPYKALAVSSDSVYDDDGEGIFVKDGKLLALADCGCIRFKQKINVCPMCARTLGGGEGMSANIEPPYQGGIRTENSVVN